MAKQKLPKDPNQRAFSFDVTGQTEGLPPEFWAQRDLLLEEVRHTFWFLKSDGPFLPSREFFEDKLVKARQAVKDWDRKWGR